MDDLQVVVVLDHCTDRTFNLLAPIRPPFAYQVLTLDGERSGVGAARNAGLERATGDVVVFNDDDVIPERDGLMWHAIKTYRGRSSIGYLTPGHDRRARASTALWQEWITGNVSVWRADITALGGFDETLTRGGTWGYEDHDMALRLTQAGVTLGYAPEARAMHLLDDDAYPGWKSSDLKWAEAKRNHAACLLTHGAAWTI